VLELRWDKKAFATVLFGMFFIEFACSPVEENLSTSKPTVCSVEEIRRLRTAAENGFAVEQSALGDLYAAGSCVNRDYGEAIKWYRKSAEQGNPDAQFSMGMMYTEGTGVAHDFAKAVEYFGMAAEKRHSKAQYALGSLYAAGRGVNRDNVRAYMWIRLSDPKGNEHARDVLTALSRTMSREEVEEAERQAKIWIDAHS
jgi:TPR repeat protein